VQAAHDYIYLDGNAQNNAPKLTISLILVKERLLILHTGNDAAFVSRWQYHIVSHL
jgi:hypothetical protein